MSFSISAVLLVLFRSPLQYAFIAALLSILIDLDHTISPNRRYEHCMHSTTILAMTALLPLTALFLPLSFPLSVLPLIAWSSHLILDLMHGETVLSGPFASVIDPIRWYRPRTALALDVAGLGTGVLFLMF